MEEREIHLTDYWRVVRKRRTTVLLFFTIVVVTVAIATFTATPMYRASCDILIQRSNPAALDTAYHARESYIAAMEFYPTQYEIIRSAAVARKVVEELNLTENPLFNRNVKERSLGLMDVIRGTLGRIFSGDDTPSPEGLEPPDPTAALAGVVQAGLSVEPVKDSQITRIHYVSPDPRFAAAVANAVAQAYIDISLDIKMGASKEAVRWLTKKIDEQREKLDESERALQEYTRKHDIIEIENRDTITPRKIQEVSVQLVEAETKRRELEALSRQLRKAAAGTDILETMSVVMNDSIIRSLRSEEISLSKKIEEMSKKYGPKHPQMIRLKADMEALVNQKREETRRVLASVERDLDYARAREASFRELLEKTKGEALALQERSVQYNVLKRQVLSNQQVHDALLKRLNETSVTSDVQSSSVTIIDRAAVPRGPISPRKGRNLLLAIIVGLFGGVGAAFFLEYLDRTLKTPDDVEERLGVPFLGLVPLVKQGKDTTGIDQIVVKAPTNPASEAYRSLRTALMLSAPGDAGHKSILITSIMAEEGKSTTAINVAEVMAQAGKNVLLVDGDMRKPRLHHVFGLDNKTGFSTLLAGLEKKVPVRPAKVENLTVLPAGPLPPNPSELLSSPRARRILEVLHGKYDMVIFDSPPMMMVTDSAILAGMVDGTVLVVRSGKTNGDTAARALKNLRGVNVSILGAILNAVDITRDAAGDYYYYTYSQGYYGNAEATKTDAARAET